MKHILIIEDDTSIAELERDYLEANEITSEIVPNGELGLQKALHQDYDLILLDVMLPGMDGYEVAKQLRMKHLGTPILMLTARSELEDRVEGLNSGADYYLTKPFDARELLACVHALLRRQGSQVDELSFGNTTLDLTSAVLASGEKEIRLSAREFEIMKLLLQFGEKNVNKEFILEKVWGYDSEAVENHVEVYIGFLRKKLKSIGSDIRIEAIRRLGYHLEAPAK